MQVTPELEERIIRAAEATPFTKHVGLRIEAIESGRVRVRLPYRAELARSYGIIHGGALMTLMDVSAGLASATAQEAYGPGVTNVTIAASFQFLGAVRERDLLAEAVCTKAGKTISFCDVLVTSEGESVAKGSFTFKATRLGP